MFPHYLGEVKSLTLLRSATDNQDKCIKILKNRITFDKNETLKLPCNWEDTVRLAHYIICSKCPPFAATQERRRRRHCLTALSITRWSRRSHSSTMRCHISQLVHILDFPAVHPLLKKAPYLVMDRVEVWTIWRPKWRREEVWCLALEQIDRLLRAVNDKLWRNFWRHDLQRILSTSHILKQPIISSISKPL